MISDLPNTGVPALQAVCGIERAASMVEKVSRGEVIAFRFRHDLRQEDLGVLLGHKSKDRVVRLWEEENGNGAPYYVRIIFAYVDRYGLGVLEELAAK